MNKRGISIISISIAVVIMLMIISVVSVSLVASVNNAKKLAFAKEIYNIQSMVTEHIDKEEYIPSKAESITIVPTDLTQFEGESVIDGSLNLNVLDLAILDIKNTNYGNKSIGKNDAEKAKDVYAVSDKTGKVYYIAGFKSKGKTYYTLTDSPSN